MVNVYRAYFENLVQYGIAFWGSSALLDDVFKAKKAVLRHKLAQIVSFRIKSKPLPASNSFCSSNHINE